MKSIFFCPLFFILFFIISPISLKANNLPPTTSITILITSDLHNWLSTSILHPRRKKMGLLHLQDQIEEARVRDPQSILLDGGDLLQGSPLAHYFNYVTQNGADKNPFFQLINRLKYDAIVIGNHDLGVPRTLLQKYIKRSNFTWLGANLESGKLKQLIPYKILQRRGLKIAILGITTPGVQMWVTPKKWV